MFLNNKLERQRSEFSRAKPHQENNLLRMKDYQKSNINLMAQGFNPVQIMFKISIKAYIEICA